MPPSNRRMQSILNRFAGRLSGPLPYAAAVAAALLVCSGASLGVVLVTSERMNGQEEAAQQALVRHAIDDLVVNVLMQQKSVAWWDEAAMRLSATGLDRSWADIEIGAFLSETYGHQQIYVADGAKLLYARTVRGVGAERWRSLQPQVATLVAHVQGTTSRPMPVRERAFATEIARYSELGGARSARWATNLALVNGEPAIIAAISIIPTVDLTAAPRRPTVLVSVVPLDGRIIESVGRRLLLNDLHVGQQDRNEASLAIKGDRGEPVAILAWAAAEPGRKLTQTLLPIIGAFILVSSLLAALMLRRLVRAWKVEAAQSATFHLQARRDVLTGLPNRRSLAESLDVRLKSGASCALAFIDVDRFKSVNDAYGHQTGDELVRTIAARLTKCDGNMLVARFGGDEFAVLAPCRDVADAETLGERLAACFDDPVLAGQRIIPATASVGIALAPTHASGVEDLLRFADIALYRAKAAGRGVWRVFDEQMATDVERRNRIELELRLALHSDSLSLAFQPIIDVASGRMHGVEALARWTHPELGIVPPSVFVAIAEEAGLMPDLGQWVLASALRTAGRWPELEISINLSPAELNGPNLLPGIRNLLALHRVEPSRIVFEITESVLLDSQGRASEALNAIRALGCQTALDDFGTGYSSLSYLRDLRFDKLKIDRSFVQKAANSRQAMTIIQSVVAMGRGLGMGLVAEGVETEAEVRLMTLAGCTELQGYYLGRPSSQDGIDAMLAQEQDRFGQVEFAAE